MEDYNKEEALKAKIIIKATIVNISPLLIGTGTGDIFDFEVSRDETGKPYIPGSGFAGMLSKALLIVVAANPKLKHPSENFWGSDEDKGDASSQSHIIVSNLYLSVDSAWKINHRDSVSINHKTNLALAKQKLDYELLEPGAKFDFRAEITIRQAFDDKAIKEIISLMLKLLETGELQQGAFKNTGFGFIKMKGKPRVFEFGFPNANTRWFDYLEGNFKPENKASEYIPSISIPEDDKLTITGDFELVSSLIIRVQADETKQDSEHQVDHEHITHDGNALLTGKTLKGVIRHRALKILNTLEFNESEAFVNDLFGFVDENLKRQHPSRIKTQDVQFKDVEMNQVQPRVKIDRFTGGTIEGAFLQNKPVWHKNETISLRFEIHKCESKEAGLLLLVMKDLFNRDLPIGGEKSIGRGLLQGKRIVIEGNIHEDNMPWKGKFTFNKEGLEVKSPDMVKMLNSWVNQLNS